VVLNRDVEITSIKLYCLQLTIKGDDVTSIDSYTVNVRQEELQPFDLADLFFLFLQWCC